MSFSAPQAVVLRRAAVLLRAILLRPSSSTPSSSSLPVIIKQDVNWSPAFNNLKTLVLNGWNVGCNVHSLVFVLHHAPILEQLILELSDV
ncbi:hypothetical protein BAE44_0006693 [Dichanthelium oligosanthes]|uniref:Uncharacterized protein n=1 Tax=Dichanthelium oligosanthes TaxID=888268 RepID=A0A1E5W4W2_9POAL|nr:hypothetical protein BAE44_0006693 [Dichanthelium oligosanthes]